MKPVILAFARYYLPGYRAGGPIRSIANMVKRLESDFDFQIVTLDRDLGDSSPYANVLVDTWNLVDKSRVFYASRSHLSLRRIARLISDTPHDVLYLNSFFDPVFALRPLLARRLGLAPLSPAVVAPRGEFSEGAVKLKRWKKAPYVRLVRGSGLYRGVTWQASSDYEVEDIVRVMQPSTADGEILVATAFTAHDQLSRKRRNRPERTHSGPLRVCFVSRISPKKNLDYSLRVLGEVRAAVHFSIYGAREAMRYWNRCEQLIDALPHNVSVEYLGPIQNELVVRTIAQHDLFFLPTRGENFGHVIHEALRAGVPVLLSDQTPWCDLEERGAGWTFPLHDPSAFVRVIEEVANWDLETADKASKHASVLAFQVASDAETLQANRRLFNSAMNRPGR